MVQDRHFDIYIVGDCPPYGSSLPLAGQIRAVNPQAPLILYSALAFAKDIERGLGAGAHAYITKPGNLDYLLATISRLLRRERPILTGAGGKAERLSCWPVSDQAASAAEGPWEAQIPSVSNRTRSTIVMTRSMVGPGACGSTSG
jgi:DNA-binding response OmpR family regulator